MWQLENGITNVFIENDEFQHEKRFTNNGPTLSRRAIKRNAFAPVRYMGSHAPGLQRGFR